MIAFLDFLLIYALLMHTFCLYYLQAFRRFFETEKQIPDFRMYGLENIFEEYLENIVGEYFWGIFLENIFGEYFWRIFVIGESRGKLNIKSNLSAFHLRFCFFKEIFKQRMKYKWH